MKLTFSERAWSGYLYWQEHDLATLARINGLLEECRRSPFRGTGKPEPLKEKLSGWWSRRITEEHRLVYRVIGKAPDQTLEVAQCRFHYGTGSGRKR
ncbi:MAG TPA: Txe/YoeB family addiction module toxin [Allosphingosinicella sp.]|nr:Txe/YoeB family addiction module toxin [Allosphingosinicella sp.]